MRIFGVVFIVLVTIIFAGCAAGGANRDVVYQTSTIQALLEGVYDGDVRCGDLLSHGDLGIGTFNSLDGEMVVLGGRCYKVPFTGRVVEVSAEEKTPFASVTPFDVDILVRDTPALNMDGLTRLVDARVSNPNVPCAIRVTGTFRYVKTRSVPAQKPPYPKLVDVVKQQRVFEFRDMPGTIVGFRLPGYMQGINVPGYHLHFLTADCTGGGHVLALEAEGVDVAVDRSLTLLLDLPSGQAFGAADLTLKHGELEKVEKDRH